MPLLRVVGNGGAVTGPFFPPRFDIDNDNLRGGKAASVGFSTVVTTGVSPGISVRATLLALASLLCADLAVGFVAREAARRLRLLGVTVRATAALGGSRLPYR